MLSYRPTGLYNRMRTMFSVCYLKVIEYIFLYSLSLSLSVYATQTRARARTHARTHFEISVQMAYRIRFVLNCSESILLYRVEYTVLFISPSGISELDCATTKTDTAERSISIGRESLQVSFCTRGLGVLPGSTARR